MPAKKTQSTIGPLSLTLLAAAFWGMSGTAAQVLFQYYYFPPVIIVTIRMILSGLILFALIKPKWPIGDLRKFVLFSIFGILPSQLFYFLAISYSNVVIATLLQYLFLPIIVGYEMLTGRFRMSKLLASAILLAIIGTVLLVVGENASIQLADYPIGVACGLVSALAVAYYTLSSGKLIKKYGSWTVTAWGFLFGGLLMIPLGMYTFVSTPLLLSKLISPQADALILFVTFFGTLLAYGLYLRGLGKLSGTESALAATAEPVAAAIVSYLALHLILSGYQYLGGALILLAIALLKVTMDRSKKTAISGAVMLE